MEKFRTPERLQRMKQEQAMDRLSDLDEELGLH
jgi:hypothetical protein